MTLLPHSRPRVMQIPNYTPKMGEKYIAAIAFDNLLGLLSAPFAGVLFALALAVSLSSLVVLARRGQVAFPSYDNCSEQDSNEFSFSKRSSLADMIIVTSSSAVGLFLFALLSNARQFTLDGAGPTITSFGIVCTAAIIAVLARLFRRRPLALYTHLVFPLAAGGLVILDSFAKESEAAAIGAGGVFFYFTFVSVFAVAFLLAVIKKGEFSAPMVVGTTMFLLASASLAGGLLSSSGLAEEARGEILLVVCTCYFVFMLSAPVVQAWRDRRVQHDQGGELGLQVQSISEEYAKRCEAITRQKGLSLRESEVLYYVGRGYNASYISKALYISDSTARTHLNNIYRKLDVTLRMQILEMFEDVYDQPHS